MTLKYFEAANDEAVGTLQRIKGNFRREMVQLAARDDGFDSIPEPWKSHELPEKLKILLSRDHPHGRGGEDLPNLGKGEVEIARATLANSIHGEVYSLRIRPEGDAFALNMVDEYQSEIILPFETTDHFLMVNEVLRLFEEADPGPVNTRCKIRYQSFFYPELC
jgi:hypothetical protein